MLPSVQPKPLSRYRIKSFYYLVSSLMLLPRQSHFWWFPPWISFSCSGTSYRRNNQYELFYVGSSTWFPVLAVGFFLHWVVFCFMDTIKFSCPFCCWWACGVFPGFGRDDQSSCEHSCLRLCEHHVFISPGPIPRSGTAGSKETVIFVPDSLCPLPSHTLYPRLYQEVAYCSSRLLSYSM